MWPSYQQAGVLDCILYKPHLKDPTQALQFAQGKSSAEAESSCHQCQGYGGSQENCKRKLQSSITTVVIVLEKVETKVLKIHAVTRIYIMSTKAHFMTEASGLGLCSISPSDHISDVYFMLIQTFDKLLSNFPYKFHWLKELNSDLNK